MELSFASNLLSGQWVYHKDLVNTHPDLYSLVKARFDRMNEENELASAAAKCRALAAEERAKELALIEQVFGTSIGLDPYNPNFYTELIRALNYGLLPKQFLSGQSRALKLVKLKLDSALSSLAMLLLR
jgi:hypothetical protein